jgi:hypothetical protein
LNIAQNGSFGFAKHWFVLRVNPNVPIVLCLKAHSFASFGLCAGLFGLQMCVTAALVSYSYTI